MKVDVIIKVALVEIGNELANLVVKEMKGVFNNVVIVVVMNKGEMHLKSFNKIVEEMNV